MGAAVQLIEFSVNEIAEKLNRNPKALYPHIRKMREVGLIVPSRQRLVGKRVETVYAPVSRRIEMSRDRFDPEYRTAIKKKLKLLIRQTEREQMRYLDSVLDEDYSISLRLFLHLRPEHVRQLKAKLLEVADWAREREDRESGIDLGTTILMAPLK